MLQISSGKFFRDVELYETLHRAVFYTNYRRFRDTVIETPVGNLSLSTGTADLATITCETVERLEAVTLTGEKEAMISTSGAELLDDLAAILSFALDITCTRDPNLAQRLISFGSKRRNPRKADHFISRTFDAEIFNQPEDDEHVVEFLKDLLALERKAYERAIRAIRRYVLGMHRIVDEDSLAYALFVMSIESLMEDEKGSVRDWQGVNVDRRTAIDKALVNAPTALAADIKTAVLKHEKPSVGPKFMDFAIDNLSASFFRKEAEEALRPISTLDMPQALKLAYSYRSRYVHSLQDIPAILRHNIDKAETAWIDGHHALTFEGMTRLARHIILQYVRTQPKCETESFNYRGSLPNVVSMPMAPQYWIWRTQGYNSKTARKQLSGFLSQVAGFMTHSPEGPITDLTDLMTEIERQVPGLAKRHNRLPMLVCYYLYNSYAPDSHKRPEWQRLLDTYGDDFEPPSIESAAGYLATRRIPEWGLADTKKVWTAYVKQRGHKNALRLPSIFEAALLLSIAEKHRETGDMERARSTIGEAVEVWPSSKQLREYEATLDQEAIGPIFWPDILIEQADSDDEQ